MECATGNELEIEWYMVCSQSRACQYVALRHFYYEYHYSPHKFAFQNIMQVGDQKLMINLEWPNKLIIIAWNFSALSVPTIPCLIGGTCAWMCMPFGILLPGCRPPPPPIFLD